MKPVYIFDMDGTLANCEHRIKHISGAEKNWDLFFSSCVEDTPIHETIRTLKLLKKGGAEIWIWTGRSDAVKKQTIEWLYKNGCGNFELMWLDLPERLFMRKNGDHQPDTKLKYNWLANLEPPERDRIVAVFEDRKSVVEMWRNAGIQCYQVSSGDF